MKIVNKKYFAVITFTTLLNIVSTQQEFKCGLDYFQCNNGQCIDNVKLCDGKADCRDKSDETESECNKPGIVCPVYAFKCNYGACIDGDLICNGNQDCVDNSDETSPMCSNGMLNSSFAKCPVPQIACDNGQCISFVELCDGKTDCNDKSDETNSRCGHIHCNNLFRCKYGACIDSEAWCNGIKDCADGSDEDPTNCRVNITTPSIPSIPTTPSIPSPPKSTFCTVPPQPLNGYRQLYKVQCQIQGSNCDVQKDIQLPSGSLLIYRCNPGYQISGSGDVVCGPEGKWLNIPVCTEIRCKSLASVSIAAECTLNGQWTSCESPVLPGTEAKLSCRNSYREETTFLSGQRNQVLCNRRGQWEPTPLKCVAVCGIFTSKSTPLIVNSPQVNTSLFPWHATLYDQETPNGPKNFICGATIIKTKFLLTAAHCVYDETNKIIRDPKRYYIATGNIFRDYDNNLHNKLVVKKAKVKNIYVQCSYLGFEGNYAWDIAILEIEEPFVFTASLLPICMDDTYIDSGTGIIAGFGRTSTGPSSSVLQYVKLPYVPRDQCKSSESALQSEKFITLDKFCAGYTNGTAVCDGDSGGGFVFKSGSLWFLRGIVSIGLGEKLVGGTRTCDSFSYSLYTRIYTHLHWIHDITFRVENSKPLPPC